MCRNEQRPATRWITRSISPSISPSIPRSIPRSLVIAGLAAGMSVSLGCGSDTTGPPADRMKDGFWALQLNHHAITLSLTAPSNQLQLVATPLDVNGDMIPTTAKVRYVSNDSSVIVDSTGLLTGRLPRFGVNVVAKLTISNSHGQSVTLSDSAQVNVNVAPTPVPVATALHIMTPGDSATFSPVPLMAGFTVAAVNASNTPLADTINVFCQSSDRRVVDWGRGLVNSPFTGTVPTFQPNNNAHLPGSTMIRCSATVYGVSLTDSLLIRMGMPLHSKLTLDTTIVPAGKKAPAFVSDSVIKIGVGGIIQWDNRTKQTVDLVFDDSTVPQPVVAADTVLKSGIIGWVCIVQNSCRTVPTAAGNVLLPPNNRNNPSNGIGRDFRKFPVAGAYHYHSVAYPTIIGTIIVTNTVANN